MMHATGNVNTISLGGRADFQVEQKMFHVIRRTFHSGNGTNFVPEWKDGRDTNMGDCNEKCADRGGGGMTVVGQVREGWQLSMDAFETACNASLLSRCKQNGLAYYW